MTSLIIMLLVTSLTISILHLIISVFISRKFLMKKTNISINRNYSISILKPIKGIDEGLERNITSFFEQEYKNYEIIFGLTSFNDPAYDIVKRICDKHSNIRSKIIVDNNKIGLNPKVNNLNNMFPFVTKELVLISDSNTRVEKKFLSKMVSEFDEQVGLVSARIRGIGTDNIFSFMENIHLNSFIAPNVIIAREFLDLPIVIGKAMMIPKEIILELGGFYSVKDFLAEDYMIGQKISQLGYKIKVSEVRVDNVNMRLKLKKFLNRHTRWAKMRRFIDLKHYVLESLSNPIVTAIWLAMFLHNILGISIMICILCFKISHDLYLAKISGMKIELKYIPFILIKDVLVAIIWFVPFLSKKIKWRENLIMISENSLLKPETLGGNFGK